MNREGITFWSGLHGHRVNFSAPHNNNNQILMDAAALQSYCEVMDDILCFYYLLCVNQNEMTLDLK